MYPPFLLEFVSDAKFRYLKWVQYNQALADSLSRGKIGYIYVPSTSFGGFKSLYEGWYAQSLTKEVLDYQRALQRRKTEHSGVR